MIRPSRILIVDNDPPSRARMKIVLAAYDYVFDEASDGIEGLQRVFSFSPDLILLDTHMPRMDGLKMCKLLQKNKLTCNIPIIMLTAHGRNDETVKCLEMGANDSIRKPFEQHDLLARVKRQLEIKKKLDRLMHEKEDLTLIQKMIHALYEKKPMYDLLYDLAQNISKIINVERCSIVRVREDKLTGVVEASSDNPRIKDFEIDLKKYPEIIEVVRSKKVLIIQDIEKADIMAPALQYLKEIRFQSLALVPIVEEDVIVGTLLLRTARERKGFSEREIWFLKAIARASRPAILNARLFEAMEERLLSAPTKEGSLTDSPLRYEFPESGVSIQLMDQIHQLKEEIQGLKQLQLLKRFQPKIEKKKPPDPPDEGPE